MNEIQKVCCNLLVILNSHSGELTEGRRPPAAYIMSAAEPKPISLRPGCTLESFCIGYDVPVCQYHEVLYDLKLQLSQQKTLCFKLWIWDKMSIASIEKR